MKGFVYGFFHLGAGMWSRTKLKTRIATILLTPPTFPLNYGLLTVIMKSWMTYLWDQLGPLILYLILVINLRQYKRIMMCLKSRN